MTNAKVPIANIAKALKVARNAKQLSQEDFSLVSSRTYVSSLERGMKSPTLSKLDELANTLEVHPLTLLTLAYMDNPSADSPVDLLRLVSSEVKSIQRT
jgi:transcriptional regulator with XRE-family HTH domain